MRLFSFVLLAAAAACASSGPSSSAPTPATQTVRVSGASGVADLRVGGSEMTGALTVPYSVEQVWRVLPFVFDSLGVPVGMMDPARRVIGNEGFKVRQRLKGTPLSRFIDCGNSTQIGSNADNYDVVLILSANVHAADAGSATVVTTFTAMAKPANFAQDYSQCSSKGLIESRFLDILKARLQR